MKNLIKYVLLSLLPFLTTPILAWQWTDLWRTADQQGAQLLQGGKAQAASQVFNNKHWKAVAYYRAGAYAESFQHFKNQKTSDSQYNAGNAAAFLGHYQEAINAYDKAIALNPNNNDAIVNREIIKKLLKKKNESNQSHSNQSSSENKLDKSNSSSSQDNSKPNNSSSSGSNSQQNKSSSPQKNSAQNHSSTSQQNSGQGKSSSSQPNQAQNSQQSDKSQGSSQSKNESNSTSGNNGQQSTEQMNAEPQTSGQWQAQENKNQILRRLQEDPGGLLQRKFFRDYLRRHANDEFNEGES